MISFVATDKDGDENVIKKNLLALSRIERISGRWAVAAKIQLCKVVNITRGLGELKFFFKLDPCDRRFSCINEVYLHHFKKPAQSDMLLLYYFFSRLKELKTLYLEVHPEIWKYLKPLLHLHTLSTLILDIYDSEECNYEEEEEDDEDDEDEDEEQILVTIADIETFSNLQYISYSCAWSLDLSLFFGPRIRPSLKVLQLEHPYSAISPLLHLFPALSNIRVVGTDGFDLLSLPPSLRHLKSIDSPDVINQFRNLGNQPFYLTHITLHCRNNFDYSVLPFIPARIQDLTLSRRQMLIQIYSVPH